MSVLNKKNCPLCGGIVHQVERTASSLSSVGREKQYSLVWKCSGCGAEFYADVRGDKLERNVMLEVEVSSVDILGTNGKGRW